MHRLEHLVDGHWTAYSHPPVFDLTHRVIAGVPGSDPQVFEAMAECLEPPYHLLYVLHTSRGEAEKGRNQSPLLSRAEFKSFLTRFGAFLSADARFDLWIHAPAEQATVVWDRHDQLFCYGPVDRYASRLSALGFTSGTPVIPVPHSHHYHATLDHLARELIDAFDWTHSPLRPEDEQ